MPSSCPRITIVTPTHNRCAVLGRAIRSVLAQKFRDFEYLVVDDGSTDDTSQLVMSFDDPRIRYIRLPQRQGANTARNIGIREAQSHWISFLDSDDEFLPQRLADLWKQIERRPTVELFLSSFRSLRHQRTTTHSNPEVTLSAAQLKEAIIAYAMPIAGTSITAKREPLLKVGGFQPNVVRMQDREVLLSLSGLIGCMVLSQVDWVKYHSEDSISDQRSGYIKAMGHLLELHPDVAVTHRNVIGYCVARHLLRNLLRGNWSSVREDWQSRRSSAWTRFGLGELLRHYRRGKQHRKSATRALEMLAREQSETQPGPMCSTTEDLDLLEKVAF